MLATTLALKLKMSELMLFEQVWNIELFNVFIFMFPITNEILYFLIRIIKIMFVVKTKINGVGVKAGKALKIN